MRSTCLTSRKDEQRGWIRSANFDTTADVSNVIGSFTFLKGLQEPVLIEGGLGLRKGRAAMVNGMTGDDDGVSERGPGRHDHCLIG